PALTQEDGELGGAGSGDQVAGGEHPVELFLIEPASPGDELSSHQCDVDCRPTEADHSELQECQRQLCQHRGKASVLESKFLASSRARRPSVSYPTKSSIARGPRTCGAEACVKGPGAVSSRIH